MAAVLFSGVASPWRSAGPALVVIVVLNSSACLPGVLPSRLERLEVERLHLAWCFGGDVMSCLTAGATLCRDCPAGTTCRGYNPDNEYWGYE